MMMTWEHFIYFAIAAVLLWAIGAFAAWKDMTRTAWTLTMSGLVVFFAFIVFKAFARDADGCREGADAIRSGVWHRDAVVQIG